VYYDVSMKNNKFKETFVSCNGFR